MIHDDSIKTKVLSELLHHMMSLHAPKAPQQHEPEASLPHVDGTPKHEPKGKIEGLSMVTSKPVQESEQAPVDMNEHGGEGEDPTEHPLSDLFGRKKGMKEHF